MEGAKGDRDDVLSAAHRRVYDRSISIFRAQVMTDEPIFSFGEIDKYLRHSQLYTGRGVVLALGVRGGKLPMCRWQITWSSTSPR